MIFKISTALFLVFIGQVNIFLQHKDVILRKISVKKNDKNFFATMQKQLVSRIRDAAKIIKKVDIAENNKIEKILLSRVQNNFYANSYKISSFYFNSIKPNWFGCWA